MLLDDSGESLISFQRKSSTVLFLDHAFDPYILRKVSQPVEAEEPDAIGRFPLSFSDPALKFSPDIVK